MKRIKYFLVMVLFGYFTILNGQVDFNLELISHTPLDQNSSDIWGYVDDQGIEYAIIGTNRSTRVFSLEDPTNPELKIDIEGASSIWRDIKTYNQHAYVVADSGADGLLIMNLSDPNNITFNKLNIEIPGGTIQQCHNLYIDTEIGIMFLAGCNTLDGVLAFDLKSDPENPVFVKEISTVYAHDVFVQDDLAYISEVFAGQLSIYDIQDIETPVLLSSVKTTSFFTHNAWANDDNTTVFTTDEVSNGTIDAYDITDKSNPIRIDAFVPSSILDQGTVPHNAHFQDDYLITSWYSYGIVITDVTNPNKAIEVAHYTTSGDSGADCWGAYPYLPSGLILASDVANGLFVLDPTYDRAAYLAGKVTDQDTGLPIFGANITILSENPVISDADPQGNYVGGHVGAGTFLVAFDHPDYDRTTIEVDLIKGETTTQDAALVKSQTFTQVFKTRLASTGQGLANVDIKIANHENSYDLNSSEVGSVSEIITEGEYTIIAGKWGQKYAIENVTFEAPGETIIELEAGYEDDFIFDYNWTVESPNVRSTWQREFPLGTSFNGSISNPNMDIPGDLGEICYITGNGSGGAGQFDVDDGTSILTSPFLDLSDLDSATLIYNAWFFNDGGSGTEPNDSFNIYVSNNDEKVLLETISENTGGWAEASSFNLAEFITLDDSVRVWYEASDDAEFGHLVEAGVDRFRVITNTVVSSAADLEINSSWSITPNPVTEKINISSTEKNSAAHISIFSLDGKLIFRQVNDLNNVTNYSINAPEIPGMYVLNIISTDGSSQNIKFVKL